jgi:hypothetical protein
MLVHIASKTFDLLGSLRIKPLPDQTTGPMARRVNRVATLDGGVVFNDGGFAHGDRDIVLTYKPVSREHDDIARRMVSIHTRVIYSSAEGVFEAVPESFEPGATSNTLKLMIVAKLSE